MRERTRVYGNEHYIRALGGGWLLFFGGIGIAVGAGDGYYTRVQAMRGKSAYLTTCAVCHADNLQGFDSAPGLAGAAFLAKWSRMSVQDLYQRIKTTMPQNAPGTLSPEVYADLTAFILRSNNFTVGPKEVPTDAEALRKLTLDGGRP